MIKIDADSLLCDFKSEARTHIETIESAFLDVDELVNAPAMMDVVFRAAHSLKGTAGFFSLDKIVAVAHELESVFSRLKNGDLTPNEDIADIALQSVDYLKDLVNNLDSPETINIDDILTLLKSYSRTQKPEKNRAEVPVPFNMEDRELAAALRSASKHGQRTYYLNLRHDKSLGKYYRHIQTLVDDILSIGSIIKGTVSGSSIDVSAASGLGSQIAAKLTGHAPALDLIVVSILEPELFLIAVELENRFVHLIPKEAIFGQKQKEPEEKKEETENKGAEKPERINEHTAETNISAANSLNTQFIHRRETDFSIRLDVSVINGLMDLANEMILTRNQLLSTTSAHRKSIAGLTPILHDMDRLTSDIQDKVMRTRMQPISVIFARFPRIIRDTAKALGKDIQIEIFGGDVALDKYLLDALSDPITQLVKNSADHGIERAERRAALGKPQKGIITLGAYMRDGSAIIEATDDGAGIDRSALKKKALERGLATEEQLASMAARDIFALIFQPGFSTAKEVTNISGRGVGMDIVKTNIEKLGGSIEIESEPDKGTTIRIKMPLTLSVVRTLIVKINSVIYAVPESNVERIVRMSAGTPAKRIERINNSLVLNLNGWLLPVVTMDAVEAKAKGLEPPSADAILNRCKSASVSKCLVLKAADKHFALLIDDAIESEETLIKPLPIYLRRCRCYSSMTVLGNGKAIMIFDAEGIMRFMEVKGVEKNEALTAGDAGQGNDAGQVIIFKCSGAEYFAVDADKITRIERIDPEHIQEIGESEYVNVAGKSVQIIRPEDCAPVQKRDYNKYRLYLLMLDTGVLPLGIGILAGRIIDKVDASLTIESGIMENDYVLGTSAYNEKILVFLNPGAMLCLLKNVV